jgi:glucosamine kinase
VSTPVTEHLVLGLDIGGTWTRTLLATTAGRRLAEGRAPGANPSAHGTAVAAERVAGALAQTLRDVEPAQVTGCVVGLAGASQYVADPSVARAFEQVWRDAGLVCPVRVTTDVAVAFAAGTAQPSGSLLLCGTGAVAARVQDREPVRLHGGYGWLLGDDGSGFWIGRQAVREALSVLDGQTPRSPLADLVLGNYFNGSAADLAPHIPAEPDAGNPAILDGPDAAVPVDNPAPTSPASRPAAALIREVNRRPAISLADLAPLVMRAHAAGDPAALAIVAQAADLLVRTFEQSRSGPPDAPIVLAGGVLVAASPVRDLVVAKLRAGWPRAEIRLALDGAAAAAWLACLPLLDAEAAAQLHRVLLDDATLS